MKVPGQKNCPAHFSNFKHSNKKRIQPNAVSFYHKQFTLKEVDSY